MEFIADLHIHSRFSMATSKNLDLVQLSYWAARKGIKVLGTGDFTHPDWQKELRENLVFDEKSGLYKYNSTFFCLQAELNCIYKKNGKTRRNHNLVFMPDLESANEFAKKLEKYGKLESDGRPALALDARNLLELVLEISPKAHLIPAHIWTPWYSLFGSKSGFDSIEECFGDLVSHIFALETGLSSDPPMNRRWSALDKFTMISNSDAHSGQNLGREANLFSGELSYDGIFKTLQSSGRPENKDSSTRFLGTLEFYPEEGKYHMDGHRNCGIMLTPEESRENNNICPVCGKPLTLGVMHRITELADRAESAHLPNEPETRMLVPLPEIIAQILDVKPSSRRVAHYVEALGTALGSELDIICRLPLSEIYTCWEPLGEAVSRIRAGLVHTDPGFDGQYGTINIFTKSEQLTLSKEEKKFQTRFQ